MEPDTRPIGERIAIYRNQRGYSQAVLAGLVGRSVSWLSQVERGERSVDKLSVLLPLARALRVDLVTLINQPVDFERSSNLELRAVDGIRAAMSTYVVDPDDESKMHDLVTLRAVVQEINGFYQAAEYDRAGSLLPVAIRSADAAANSTGDGDERQEALTLLALTNQVSAALLSRVGQTDLGWVAADRAINSARQVDDVELIAAGIYRLGQIMLKAGRAEEAYRLADSTIPTLDSADSTPSDVIVTWSAAIHCCDRGGQTGRPSGINEADAQDVADKLGADRNDHWTAFGPTNVRIHATSAAVELGDPNDVLHQAAAVDPDQLPKELRGRRSQVYIDQAWAYSQQRNDAEAVLSLMEAERVAPDTVKHNPIARRVLQDCLRRGKRSPIPGVTQLAQRVGVLD